MCILRNIWDCLFFYVVSLTLTTFFVTIHLQMPLVSGILNKVSMHIALSLHSQRQYTCFMRIEILNIVLSMQSYKLYCQKSSVIVPDKQIKIIKILLHIFSEFIYIFLQNLEWQFVRQTGGIQVGANWAEPFSLTLVNGNLREAEWNLNFDLEAQHYHGRCGWFQ